MTGKGAMNDSGNHNRILVLANRDFVLYNFRIELLERLIQENYEVFICLPDGPKVKDMTAVGCCFVPVAIDTRGVNPFRDAGLIRSYQKIFREIRPDMILTYTTKVCIYTGIIAGHMRVPYLLNVSGLGTAVEQRSFLQPFIIRLYRQAAKRATCVFFQNEENRKFFQEHHMYRGRERLIPGSGVNLEKWNYLEYPADNHGIHFLFIARIIKEKGIEEYLACAETIKKESSNTFFHVLGPCDGAYEEALAEYERRGIIRYHGEVRDTAEYLKTAHCTIHPSYYPEGISNVLLESAASGRPVITTDRSGCRETVENNVTGFCFETKNREQLMECVRKFLRLTNTERREMGVNGRRKMEREFDREIVVRAYMEEIKV
ncbi:MAG: glycosyltransferase family 4 protein [Roseburia sp.]|nr:glycosyltransferase family 4 protein [Roseburia sp.]MCM1202061.1 glycosyltransferase family 4 protein [Bacteroides fragilis]